VLDLGTVRPGETVWGTIVVRNRTDRTVEVARVHTSCECVGIDPDRFSLEAGERLPLMVRLDPDNPDFAGRLNVDIRAFTPSDAPAFQGSAAVTVETTAVLDREEVADGDPR
jgi:hypothetical protein